MSRNAVSRFLQRGALAAGLTVAALFLFPVRVAAQVTFTEIPGPSTPSFEEGNALVDITRGPDGNLWFTEGFAFGAQTQIGRITPAGVTTYFPVPSGDSEGAITAGPDGNLWFAEYRVGRIGRITTGGTVTEFPIPGGGFPQGITAGPDGNLWFTEAGGVPGAVGRVAPAGSFTVFPLPGGAQASRITAGVDGNLWFTEGSTNKIGRITTGGVIAEFPIPSGSSNPNGITSGPDGNLWFTEDSAANKIGRITTAGVITEFPVPTSGASPQQITTGPDGNLWFTEDAGNNIGRITTAGVITEFPVPTTSRLTGITTGPDGNLWFLELNANKIAKASLGATFTLSSGIVASGNNITLPLQFRSNGSQVTAAGWDLLFDPTKVSLSGVAAVGLPPGVGVQTQAINSGRVRVIAFGVSNTTNWSDGIAASVTLHALASQAGSTSQIQLVLPDTSTPGVQVSDVNGNLSLANATASTLTIPVRGDLNGNDAVDVGDIQLEVNVFLGRAPFIPSVNDLNGNGIMDVGDVQLEVDLFLGRTPSAARAGAHLASPAANGPAFRLGNDTVKPGAEAALTLDYAPNGAAVTAAGFDLIFDSSKVTFKDITAQKLPQGVGIKSRILGPGRVRFVLFGTKTPTAWAGGKIATIHFTAAGNVPKGTESDVVLAQPGTDAAGVQVTDATGRPGTALGGAGTVTFHGR